MICQITRSEFTAAFHNMGRGDQFSHIGLLALYDFLNDCDPEIELDVIGLCCDFTEYNSIDEALKEYNFETQHELEDHTFIIHVSNGGIILQNF